MHQELANLGLFLKEKRQEKNLSLKEVENGTSIRMSYLEAIEEGQVAKLISPVYAQGFIRKYATFLELDGDDLIRRSPYLMKLLNEGSRPGREAPMTLGALEMRGTPGSEVKWFPNLMWVGLSVVVILAGWFIARHFGIF
ncbi:MAG: helix-turn-helix domain-containing protein [Chlamydiia bacterium]|nr:helix-turn-helix domain-containing protein [Chlamydiia bacterium]